MTGCVVNRVGGAPAVDETGRPRSEEAVAGAMIDWWMLSRARRAVLSDKSSFGYAALAMSMFNESALPVTISRDTRVGSCPETIWEGHLCDGQTC